MRGRSPIVLISDPIDRRVTVTTGDVSTSVHVPTQTLTSRVLPSFKEDVMLRVHEANRMLKAKEVALGEYYDLLNGVKKCRWVVVLN